MRFNLLPPSAQLARIMSRIYRYGLTTTSGGNLSILDDDGSLWITPAGVDKAGLGPHDIMRVYADDRIEGPHRPSSEYPFHRMIYRRRTDVRAIVHAHAPALVSFSIARRTPDTDIIPQAHHVCGEVGYAPYALPGSWELGERIADTFAEGYNVVLLENHGAVAVGPDLLTAFQRLETLDFCARTQLQALGLGEVKHLSQAQIAQYNRGPELLPTFTPERHSSRERELRQAVVRFVHRAYDQRLMTSTEGTVSTRVADDSFVITPYGVDRRYVQPEDLVLVDAGRSEVGKQPSRAVQLHQAIYRQHPYIGCIIMAQSPNATAYALTGRPFDTRTIPESYVVLRQIATVPYDDYRQNAANITAVISENTPVVLIQNDTVLTTGATLDQAFDRLEVADFTALSLINCQRIGPLVPISAAEVEALEEKFLR